MFHLAVTQERLMQRWAKVKAQTVLVAIKQQGFPLVFSLRHFISFASHVTDVLTISPSQE